MAEEQAKLCFVLAYAFFLLGFFFDLKLRVIYSSATSVDFQQTTHRYIPK
jgi:hypothetical protein